MVCGCQKQRLNTESVSIEPQTPVPLKYSVDELSSKASSSVELFFSTMDIGCYVYLEIIINKPDNSKTSHKHTGKKNSTYYDIEHKVDICPISSNTSSKDYTEEQYKIGLTNEIINLTKKLMDQGLNTVTIVISSDIISEIEETELIIFKQ